MQLADLVVALRDAVVKGAADIDIRGFSIDSRSVAPGDLFVALRGGEEQDRHAFIPDALRRGVSAVLLEDDLPTGAATSVRVPDVKRALACAANRFYGEPARELTVVGVTGTSGKTTTTFLIRSILTAAGIATGRIGTHHNVVGGKLLPSNNTTPYAHQVFALLRGMVDAGDRAAVMEVSSHALALDRVFGIDFDAAVFTNLTRDHLNFHGTVEAYFNAKAVLFERLCADGASAILNADDPMCAELERRTRARVLTYGTKTSADIHPRACVTDLHGTRLTVATPSGPVDIQSNLLGPFNVANLLAATATACALDIAPQHIHEGLLDVRVPGRFENVRAGQPFAIVVDFAHKPDALEKVLAAARSLASSRLICVFGCGGDRDRGKRPIMGEIAARLADLTIVTSDNPRTENPAEIVKEIAAGIPPEALRGMSARVAVEVDRRTAIEKAVALGRPGDVVLLAGKGDEDYQEVAGVKYAFDDKLVAAEAVRKLGAQR